MSKTTGTKEVQVPAKGNVGSRNTMFWALTAGLVGFLLYINTVGNQYVLDDNNSILQNSYVQEGFRGIPKLMTVDYWFFAGMNLGYYRPLSLISFAIEHQLFGNNPYISHFDNALLYGLTGFALFLLLLQLFPKKHKAFSFLICLLFLAHPIHTEVVANIKSRDEILSFLNILAMCCFAFFYIKTHRSRDLVLSLIFTYLALLSKETAGSGVLLLGVFFYFSGKSILNLTKRIVPYLGIVLIFFIQKSYFLGGTAKNIPKDLTNYPYLASTVRLPSTFHIFWLYLQKLVFPWPLCYDYSYNQIPASHWTDTGAWLGLISFIALLFLTIKGVTSKTTWGLAIAILMVTIAPAFGFTLLRGGIMAERLVYAPCLAIAILIVYGGSKISGLAGDSSLSLMQWTKKNPTLLALSLPVFICYGFETINRSPDWKDNLTLFAKDVIKAPESSEANFLYGNELIAMAPKENDSTKKSEDFITGINALRKAVSLTSNFGEAYNQMGYAYTEVYPDYDSAVKYYKLAIDSSGYAIAYVNLGTLYQKKGRLSLASYYYNQAIKVNPNLAAASQYKANLKKATGLDVKEFPGEDKTDPQFMRPVPGKKNEDLARQKAFKAQFDSGTALLPKGDYKGAIKYFEKAERLDPDNTQNLLYLANSLGLSKNYKKAINTFEKILKITPGDTVIMNNLAQTYRITGQGSKSDALQARVKSLRK